METLTQTYAKMSDEEFLSALREATLSLDAPNTALVREAYRRLWIHLSTTWLEKEEKEMISV